MSGLRLDELVATMPRELGARLLQPPRPEKDAGAPPRRVRALGVAHDSRQVEEGFLFVAIPGATVDGAKFAEAAVEKGAVAVMTERELDLPVPQIVVADARRGLAFAAQKVYGEPTRRLTLVGITGTNGKTTTSWLLDGALRWLGARPALLGTVAARLGEVAQPAQHTTPEADDFARFAHRAAEAGAGYLTMEVSSHGLALHRVDGARFSVAAYTNFSRDHLDFHETLADYEAAKTRLFTDLEPGASVISVDDEVGLRIAAVAKGRVWTVSSAPERKADIWAQSAESRADGTNAKVAVEGTTHTLATSLVGPHNLQNVLVALGCLVALGVEHDEAVASLSEVQPAPGRFESVANPGGATVLVDYAHTPDALARALEALRPLTPGRLIVVFGCGGDRDHGKRPKMGEAAARGADLVVVTSDNPRTEDPQAIVDAIIPGVTQGGQQLASDLRAARGFVVEVDRAAAIERAITGAHAADVVLIAGKGHEDYQIVGTEKRDFDDRKIARETIARLDTSDEVTLHGEPAPAGGAELLETNAETASEAEGEER